jgi:hypothetical protein
MSQGPTGLAGVAPGSAAIIVVSKGSVRARASIRLILVFMFILLFKPGLAVCSLPVTATDNQGSKEQYARDPTCGKQNLG